MLKVRRRHQSFPVSTGKDYEHDQPTTMAHIGKFHSMRVKSTAFGYLSCLRLHSRRGLTYLTIVYLPMGLPFVSLFRVSSFSHWGSTNHDSQAIFDIPDSQALLFSGMGLKWFIGLHCDNADRHIRGSLANRPHPQTIVPTQEIRSSATTTSRPRGAERPQDRCFERGLIAVFLVRGDALCGCHA